MTPKIKVEADLSSAEQALASFRQELAELKREASSVTGKTKFETEFQAAGSALNKLMKHYDELLKKLGSVEQSGKRYANILKEIGELTREAAKVSSRLEDFGSLKSNARSSYFSGESAIHRGDMQRVLDQMRAD
jgi:predicted  nucleic acid-binding Zn-ribbon protein